MFFFRYCRIIIILIILLIIIFSIVRYTIRPRSSRQFVYPQNIIQYANASWARQRIPRLIHQTYKTRNIPIVWNATVQSVIQKNTPEFEYRLWTHEDMDAFVEQHEPDFYEKTYITYKYDMQRIDSFRYVLMFYLGGIYIDMDNGCRRPLRDLVSTLESLDPNSTHLLAFPSDHDSGFQTDFIISTTGHPFHKQLISRLHLFNYNYFFHYLTIFASAGALYVRIQERFFNTSENQTIRILDPIVYDELFIWKTNGGTWHNYQDRLLLYVYFNRSKLFSSFMQNNNDRG